MIDGKTTVRKHEREGTDGVREHTRELNKGDIVELSVVDGKPTGKIIRELGNGGVYEVKYKASSGIIRTDRYYKSSLRKIGDKNGNLTGNEIIRRQAHGRKKIGEDDYANPIYDSD